VADSEGQRIMRREITAYGWPRGMREPVAAEYIGLSVSSLRAEVGAGRKVYLREDLDSYLDAKARRAPPAEPSVNPWLTVFDGPASPPAPRKRK
jgi:hypothetical protein